jgi:hypothetical protein
MHLPYTELSLEHFAAAVASLSMGRVRPGILMNSLYLVSLGLAGMYQGSAPRQDL